MQKTNPLIKGIRLILIFTSSITLFLGITGGIGVYTFEGKHFVTVLTALISLAITYIPDFVSNKDIMIMPIGLQALFSGFTFCAMFMGEILNFYERFSWWDTMLHFTSGFMFSVIGFMLFLSFNRDATIRRQINPVIIVMFTVCFSIACGAVWEIFEFAGDSLLGMNMQRWQSGIPAEQWSALQNASNFSNPGLINTMKDIISDTFGSLLSITFILPLAKYKSNYKKVRIPQTELLTEYSAALAGIQMIRCAPKTSIISNRYNFECGASQCQDDNDFRRSEVA